MKGKFEFDWAEEQLQQMFKNKSPFVALTVDTTGLDTRGFTQHCPTAVYAQEFVYDEYNRIYVPGNTFDEQVTAAPDAMAAAMDSISKGGFNTFEYSGIDADAYSRGEYRNGTDGKVQDPAAIKEQLNKYLSSMKPGTVFIANNADHCIKYLDKIECADILKELQTTHRLLDQPKMTAQFFREHNINLGKATLDNLNAFIENANKFMLNRNISKFNEVNQDELNAYIAERAPGTARAVRGMEKANVINQFVIFKAREYDMLMQLVENEILRDNNSYADALSEAGKEKYKNANETEKVDVLKKIKVLDDSVLISRAADSNLNKFYNVTEGKDGKKGVVIFNIATTGFTAENIPISLTASCYEMENGKLELQERMSFNIQATAHSIQTALDIIKKNGFNAFDYAKIDPDEYQKSNNMLPENAAANFANFMKKYSTDEYLYATAGKKAILTGLCMLKHPELEYKKAEYRYAELIKEYGLDAAQVLDVTELIKEYCGAMLNNKHDNVLTFNQDWSGRKYGLQDFADIREMDIRGTAAKVEFMSELLSNVGEQYYTLKIAKTQELENARAQAEAKAAAEETITEPVVEPMPEQTATANTESVENNVPDTEGNANPYRIMLYRNDNKSVVLIGKQGVSNLNDMCFPSAIEARSCAIDMAQGLESGTYGFILYNENNMNIEIIGNVPLNELYSKHIFDDVALKANGLWKDEFVNTPVTIAEAPKNGYSGIEETINDIPRRSKRSPGMMPRHNETTTVCINAFGNSGEKSLICKDVVNSLKEQGFIVEYIPDNNRPYARGIAQGGSVEAQQELLKEQTRQLDRYAGRADFIVTETPLLMCAVAMSDNLDNTSLESDAVAAFNKLQNVCFKSNSVNPSIQERLIDEKVERIFKNNEISYIDDGADMTRKVVNNALRTFARNNPDRADETRKALSRGTDTPRPVEERFTRDRGERRPVAAANDESVVVKQLSETINNAFSSFFEKTTELISTVTAHNSALSEHIENSTRATAEVLETNKALSAALIAFLSEKQQSLENEKKNNDKLNE